MRLPSSSRPGPPPPSRVLLASADVPRAATVARTLRRGWMDVTCVEHGASALGQLRSGRYDAAVLDADLPGLSGVTVCRWVREHSGDRDLPVVVLASDTGAQAQAEAAGASATVVGPVRPRFLRHRVATLLRHGAPDTPTARSRPEPGFAFLRPRAAVASWDASRTGA